MFSAERVRYIASYIPGHTDAYFINAYVSAALVDDWSDELLEDLMEREDIIQWRGDTWFLKVTDSVLPPMRDMVTHKGTRNILSTIGSALSSCGCISVQLWCNEEDFHSILIVNSDEGIIAVDGLPGTRTTSVRSFGMKRISDFVNNPCTNTWNLLCDSNVNQLSSAEVVITINAPMFDNTRKHVFRV